MKLTSSEEDVRRHKLNKKKSEQGKHQRSPSTKNTKMLREKRRMGRHR